MNIYVIRHGQTDWNVNRLYQGQTDIPLNAFGIEQAKILSNKIKNIHFDVVISSPLKRAIQTANISLEGRYIPIQIDDRLLERSFGDLEGQSPSSKLDCTNDVLFDYEHNYDGYHVEPIKKLFSRVYSLMDDLIKKYKDKNLLLVTHSAVTIAIDCYFNGIPNNKNLVSLALDNCNVKKYVINGEINNEKI